MNVSDIQKAKTPALLGISSVICMWSSLEQDSLTSPLPRQNVIALVVVMFKDKTCS